jgi:exopolysaccharide production protein ExoZ
LSFALIIAGLLVFTFLPVTGDSLLLVKGLNRVIFTLICLVVCLSFYKTDFRLPHFADKIFRTLGEISYSVYLVHPVMWHFLSVFYQRTGLKLPGAAQLAVGFTCSLLTAYFIYRFFEKYFMKMGKIVTKRLFVSS